MTAIDLQKEGTEKKNKQEMNYPARKTSTTTGRFSLGHVSCTTHLRPVRDFTASMHR